MFTIISVYDPTVGLKQNENCRPTVSFGNCSSLLPIIRPQCTIPLRFTLTTLTHFIRSDAVVRRAYTIFLRTRSKKMRDLSVFAIQCYKFLLCYIVR